MRNRNIALTAAIVLLSACQSATAPTEPVGGNYSLEAVNGSRLPYPLVPSVSVVSGYLNLDKNGTYTEDRVENYFGSKKEQLTHGTWVVTGERVILTEELGGGASLYSAAVGPNTIVYTDGNYTYTFQK